MSEQPSLTLPRMNDTFHVFTDASQEAVCMALMQENDHRRLRAVQFAGRSLTNVEKRYNTSEREAAGIIIRRRTLGTISCHCHLQFTVLIKL